MKVELVTLAALTISGAAFVNLIGFRSFLALPLYLLCGISLYVIITYIQILANAPTSPVIPVSICLILGIMYLLYDSQRILNPRILATIAFMLLVLVVLIITLMSLNLVKFHIDSIGYLIVGSLIEGGNVDIISVEFAVKRFSSIAILHAPANLTNELYLRSLGPFIGLCTIGALFWFTYVGLAQTLSRKQAITFAVAGCLLLVTTNRFIWHCFYINGHLITAAFMLLVAGSGWLVALKAASYKPLLYLQAMAVAGLVLSRPEGAFLAALALLPTLLTPSIPWRSRAVMLVVFGLSVMLQQGLILSRLGRSVPSSVFELFGFAAASILLSPILGWRLLVPYLKYALPVIEGLLWAGVLAFTVKEPDMLLQSAASIFQNFVLGKGGWGLSSITLALLVIATVFFTYAPHRVFLRFPITAFVPLALLLAFLRDEPYRVGVTDALSRMFIHIVPVAILLVASAAASRRWGLWKPRKLVVGRHARC